MYSVHGSAQVANAELERHALHALVRSAHEPPILPQHGWGGRRQGRRLFQGVNTFEKASATANAAVLRNGWAVMSIGVTIARIRTK